MRVLVTGGCGFIGSHIVTEFRGAGHEVVVLDALLPTAHPVAPTERDEVIRADVRDRAAMMNALDGVDLVCHQAAMVGQGRDFADAPDYVGCNDLGTAVLLAAMTERAVNRLVLAGSMVVYGEGRYRCAEHGEVRPGPRSARDLAAGHFEPTCPRCSRGVEPRLVDEDGRLDPRNLYAATKLAQEHLVGAWARATEGRAFSLRYHNVYGPDMPRDTPYAGVAAFFRSALAAGEPPRVFEDGRQRRDFVHVRDIATANVIAAEALSGAEPGSTRAYNVASGQPHTIGEMATALSAAHGGPTPVITGEFRLGDVRHITASVQRLNSELGWSAQVGFEEGIKEFATAPLRPTGRPRTSTDVIG